MPSFGRTGGFGARGAGQTAPRGPSNMRRMAFAPRPPVNANRTIAGVTRDSTGAALGGCTVKLFETGTDVLVAQQVSDGSGNYSFTVPGNGTYYELAYKDGAPAVTGASLNTLQGT